MKQDLLTYILTDMLLFSSILTATATFINLEKSCSNFILSITKRYLYIFWSKKYIKQQKFGPNRGEFAIANSS